jgi:Spy/CpxP family protein refolding chaperone
MSYGKRYCTIALLNIISEAPEDADVDGHDGKFVNAKGGGLAEVPAEQPKITAAQRDKIVELITAAKIKEQNFCTKYGIGQIGMLPADLFDAAVKAIADHVEAARAK